MASPAIAQNLSLFFFNGIHQPSMLPACDGVSFYSPSVRFLPAKLASLIARGALFTTATREIAWSALPRTSPLTLRTYRISRATNSDSLRSKRFLHQAPIRQAQPLRIRQPAVHPSALIIPAPLVHHRRSKSEDYLICEP